MTRRDLQGEAKKTGRPWEIGKAFEHSAPCSDLVPASEIGHPAQGAIWLKVNGALRQEGNLDQMIWKVPEKIGRASGRERVCQYVSISVVDVALKTKKKSNSN